MKWRNFFPASRRENGSFEVWPVRSNFYFLPKVVALVFTVIFSENEKNQNHRTCKSDQSRDEGFPKEFSAVRPQARLHFTQPIWSQFFQKYDINAQNISWCNPALSCHTVALLLFLEYYSKHKVCLFSLTCTQKMQNGTRKEASQVLHIIL